jgi:hypothetical protein
VRGPLYVVFHDDWVEPPGTVITSFWDREEADRFVTDTWWGYGYSVLVVPLPA